MMWTVERRSFVLVVLAMGACWSGCSGSGAPDAGLDAPPGEPDAYSFPVERLYLNPAPPRCEDRDQPPRWRAPTPEAPPGTVLWVASLRNEERFLRWRAAANTPDLTYPRTTTSLTGDGIAMWFSLNHERGESWGLGLSAAEGQFANSGQFDSYQLPRIWLPRLDAFLTRHGAFGRDRFVPPPPLYPAQSGTSSYVEAGIGASFWEGGPMVGGVENADMPAWSPYTGDIITFGLGRSGFRGVGAGCSEGTRWFTQLPLGPGLTRVFVREDGDVVVGSMIGDVWILDGETGEPLRSASFVDERGFGARPSVYHPGCGLLMEVVRAEEWRWLDVDSLELGPRLRLPEDAPTNVGIWSGTPDCGLVAPGGIDPLYLTRLDADGAVRYRVVFRETGHYGSVVGPPIALADGGTLLVTTPPGWIRYDAAGNEISRVPLEIDRVGFRSFTEPVLAPDGTLFLMTDSGGEDFRFFAATTGAIPGPFLWPDSGYNWARTNSVLPE